MITRGLRNNNPGNIRLSSVRYQGEITGTDKSFKTFKSMPYGYRAMCVILRTYITRYKLNTIRKMINRWAPDNENDTENYIHHVAAWSGINENTVIDPLSKAQMCAIVAAMSRMENGVAANITVVRMGYILI